jgi:hypothetical protein
LGGTLPRIASQLHAAIATQLLGAEPIQGQLPFWLMPSLITISTAFGIASRSIYEVGVSKTSPSTYKGILSTALAPSRMLVAWVASPVVIALFYDKIIASDDILFVLLTSFQNGFFWKTLLEKRK